MRFLFAIMQTLLITRAGAQFLEENNMTEEAKTTKETTVAVSKSKFGKQKTVEIKRTDGETDTYLLQYPGIRKVMEMIDDSMMPNGILARSVYAEQLLKEVVVQPANLTIDDFDEREGLQTLVDEADEFLGEIGK